jgi:hypothetical protein
MTPEFAFNEAFTDATDEQLWEQIRHHRNMLLKSTDWTGLLDCTMSDPAWREYRQALRDLPTQNADPKKIVFPTRPEA